MGEARLLGFDTETHLISAEAIIPRMVCATLDLSEPKQLSPTTNICDTYQSGIMGNGDLGCLDQMLDMWQSVFKGRGHLIIHNASFDVTVVMRYCQDVISGAQKGYPRAAKDLYLLIWDVLDNGLDAEMAGLPHFVHCTGIREKLWMLSTRGRVEMPGARSSHASLADLVKAHFNVDISGKKVTAGANGRVFDASGVDITGTVAGDSWRLRYSELDGIPTDQWPSEAVSYAIDDATWARKVYVSQEAKRQPAGFGSINSESLQVYADCCLRIYSATGFNVDRTQVAKVQATVDERLAQTNGALRMNGVLRPNDTVNTAVLHDRIVLAWKQKGQYPILTETGAISANAEVLETLAPMDPIIHLFQQRSEVMKIQSSFLPNMGGTKVYTNYDILKETGRTSSYGNSDKGTRKPLFEAVNIQQIPKGLGARSCFLPPTPLNGVPYVIFSGDYSGQELCSVAQVTYSLFGASVHRDKLNAGYDLHTYLGANMAMALDPATVDYAHGAEDAYKVLNRKRKLKIPEGDGSAEAIQLAASKAAAIQWRTFAKPVGLGYPGGLGPATLCTMAKGDYGIDLGVEQAKTFRDIWHGTYPEMRQYFNWVNTQKDASQADLDAYCYETQGFGRFRAGATYCATANGKAMQSLSSDGSKRSVCWIARACSDGLTPDSAYSLLNDCLPLAFIHDENLLGMPLDLLTTERGWLVCKLMVSALQLHMPDVRLVVEPTIMHRWSKTAEPKWATDPHRGEKVFDALNARGRFYGVTGFADIVADALGPEYDPSQVLHTWDAA